MAKASGIVFIGCRLPHGLIIEHPMDATKKIELKGQKHAVRSKIVILQPDDYGVTEVAADFAEQWFAVNKEYPAVLSGAIFMAKNKDDLAAAAAETLKQKTGFEGMPTDKKELAAIGFKELETAEE